MHLNDKYDAIRGQILLMDPLPDLNKAYSMIVRVEKQKQVTSHLNASSEMAAYVSRTGQGHDNTTNFPARGASKSKRDNKKIRNNKYCDHCHRTGHT